MKTCTKCHLSYDDDKKFCKKCGSQLVSENSIDPKNLARKTVLEDRLKMDPLNLELLHEYAQFLFNNLLFKETISFSLKIQAINEEDELAKELLFKSYVKLDMFKEANTIGEQLIERRTTDIFLYEKLAIIANKLENKNKASDYYDKIIGLQPANTFALYNKALILLDKNMVDDAIAIFETIYPVKKDDRITAIYYGISKTINKDYDTAIRVLNPFLSDENLAYNDRDNNRGFLYLSNCLVHTSFIPSEIEEWFNKIDFTILGSYYYTQDEFVLIESVNKISELILNNIDDNTSYPKSVIDNLINVYLQPILDYVDLKTNSELIANIWFNIAKKQYEFNYHTDSYNSCKNAVELNSNNDNYKKLLCKIESFLNALKRKRKKNTIIITIICALILALFLFLRHYYLINKQFEAWDIAVKENNFSSFQNYLNNYPNGKYVDEAKKFQEEAFWKRSKEINTLQSYHDYIDIYPNGKYIKLAKSKLNIYKPPTIINNACPFEGCTMGEWIAENDLNVYSSYNKDTKAISSISYGERIQAIRGIFSISQFGEVKITKTNDYFPLNDTIFILAYKGEGSYMLWYKGKIFDDHFIFWEEKNSSGQKIYGRKIKNLKSDWWVYIKKLNNIEGWILMKDGIKFSGMDAFD